MVVVSEAVVVTAAGGDTEIPTKSQERAALWTSCLTLRHDGELVGGDIERHITFFQTSS